MEPSSSNTGFFQEAPVLHNQFRDDVAFRRAYNCTHLSCPTLAYDLPDRKVTRVQYSSRSP